MSKWKKARSEKQRGEIVRYIDDEGQLLTATVRRAAPCSYASDVRVGRVALSGTGRARLVVIDRAGSAFRGPSPLIGHRVAYANHVEGYGVEYGAHRYTFASGIRATSTALDQSVWRSYTRDECSGDRILPANIAAH